MLTQADVKAATAALVSLEAPRVWSMLVSIFGDLASHPRDHIEGPLLTRLTDRMEIKPEAVRVALHRLRNDGWISSTKSGRTANHALTPNALKQRNDAAPLIYARAEDLPQDWHLAVTPQGDTALRTELTEAGFVAVSPRLYIGHGGTVAPRGALLCTGQSGPDWIREELVPSALTAQFDTLLTALQKVQHRLSGMQGTELSHTETALLRSLIVHHWRRLVLRHPYLPPALLGADWPGHRCRALVCDLLEALPRPPLEALAAEDRRAAS